MVKRLDNSLLEQASKLARYGSEINKPLTSNDSEHSAQSSSKVQKPLPGRIAEGQQLRVPPTETILWKGNPRNFERDLDVSQLRELVKASGGNTEAVTGRRVAGGQIQIIAGKRRRQSCLDEDLPILVNVFDDLSDEECHFIADLENRGRKDLSHIAYCQYLAHRFEELAEKTSTKLKVAEFAKRYQLSRQHMQTRISTGRLPAYLFNHVPKMDAWGVRQTTHVMSIYNSIMKKGGLSDIEIEDALEKSKNPSDVISRLESLLSNDEGSKPKAREEAIRVGEGVIAIKESTKGILTIKCNANVDEEIKLQVENFVRSL